MLQRASDHDFLESMAATLQQQVRTLTQQLEDNSRALASASLQLSESSQTHSAEVRICLSSLSVACSHCALDVAITSTALFASAPSPRCLTWLCCDRLYCDSWSGLRSCWRLRSWTNARQLTSFSWSGGVSRSNWTTACAR